MIGRAMILLGQYDSPFVRRVAIALRLYQVDYEHRPWSVWGDAEKIAAFNPLRRVPTLILDDGTCLIESAAILDALDDQAEPARLLCPRTGPVRRECLRVSALGTGLADKAVTLFYEPLMHQDPSARMVERCVRQIGDVLQVLEDDRQRRPSAFWLGASLSHADIAVACAFRFTREAHPQRFDLGPWPALARHAEACEALPVFQEIVQPLTVRLSTSGN